MTAPASRNSTPVPQRQRILMALLLLALGAAAPIQMAPTGGAGTAFDRCGVPPDIAALGAPLARTSARLAAGKSLTIVAFGSSSTEGIGATQPGFSYPSRLAAILKARFPGIPIRVINRGIGGEIAPQMLARLDRDVLAERPDLVIWQLGTNSVLHDLDPAAEAEMARRGIERIRATGADVMLMDLQYAPVVLSHPGYREMEHVLAAVAHAEEVPLLHRFAAMRHWAEDGQMTLPVMLAADRLHMSDVSYDCLARQIARSLIEVPLFADERSSPAQTGNKSARATASGGAGEFPSQSH